MKQMINEFLGTEIRLNNHDLLKTKTRSNSESGSKKKENPKIFAMNQIRSK